MNKTLTDPSTGEVLGTRKKVLGVVTVTEVQDKLAIGGYKGLEPGTPKRGDLVMMMEK